MDENTRITVVGVFLRPEDAQSALVGLRALGYRGKNISVLSQAPDETDDDSAAVEAADGAVAGAAVGGLLGGLGGWLVGLGLLAIPGLGPLVAAGPLAAALAGAASGALAGGVTGALIDAAIPDEHAELYTERLRAGRTLVVAHVRAQHAETVKDVFRAAHAERFDFDVDDDSQPGYLWVD